MIGEACILTYCLVEVGLPGLEPRTHGLKGGGPLRLGLLPAGLLAVDRPPASPDARVDVSSRHDSRHAERSLSLGDLTAIDQLTIGQAGGAELRGSLRVAPLNSDSGDRTDRLADTSRGAGRLGLAGAAHRQDHP